jgi:hypothetical protein
MSAPKRRARFGDHARRDGGCGAEFERSGHEDVRATTRRRDYTKFPDVGVLKGARVGILNDAQKKVWTTFSCKGSQVMTPFVS